MVFSLMDLEPTMKFSCSDVHPGLLVFLRMENVEIQGEKCHSRSMMHSEADKDFKMNSQHVPLSQSVEGKRPGKT